jgi:hypothetical protein
MQRYRLTGDYHAANNNCTTLCLVGLRAADSGLSKRLGDDKYNQLRGLSWFQRQAFNFSRDGAGVRVPLDLQAGAEDVNEHIRTHSYRGR